MLSQQQSMGYGVAASEHALLKSKVNTALKLLTDSELSIAEIAYACDFADCTYFCAKFKRVMGESSGRFRRSTQTVDGLIGC